MSKKFLLPDLGEGLPDATIVEWYVKVGDVIKLDDNLVSMETAKAVVDVPSPVSGKVLQLAGAAGDIVVTGTMLAEFEVDASMPQRAEGQDTGHHHDPTHDEPKPVPVSESAAAKADAGTVVGAMQVGDAVVAQAAIAAGGVKAMPAVRATARKLGVDIARVAPSGADGTVTMNDVKRAAADGSAKPGAAPARAVTPAAAAPAPVAPAQRSTLSQSGKPMRTQPPGAVASGQPEQLKGVRRNMARVMADAHAQVVPTTLVDDADLHAWSGRQDITARLVRGIVAACKAVPALNAWFDGANLTRTLHPHVDLGIAVDTDDGLFVPALRNADMLDGNSVRAAIKRLRTQVEDRSIPSSELSGYTISLSNFGMFAGRYATPVVVPPCVAIVGAGKLSHDVVAVMGGIEVHRRMPISLTFDHRACTGGEAARFLAALLDDLAQPA
ncbi:dihydrolipoamide acetyltransferase family protein [Thermomonas carbonis]|uniref:Dihydrolipoamide acetyltransferase component of pyruvate dehydrogenase complex n=1 Tax=Thermomonas carbonis TaxID=1463158 RepID=A0A7G9SU12_9GAMM|nr:dihydrolipoamide acetyltransferase family protein [Thermomonas carbonis]QNN71337.1 2-oxo acid dehydrogenase subunit E2 [Thermomonas carbonis]GHC10259.1 dihydrolipoamide acetyltransferase component of pyruvate dehydrogenase complex [Thermomonas carbonis]